jgi:hypothetical protein
MTTIRRLEAILAADVAGYSRLMGADEEGTMLASRSISANVTTVPLSVIGCSLPMRCLAHVTLADSIETDYFRDSCHSPVPSARKIVLNGWLQPRLGRAFTARYDDANRQLLI